MAASSGAQEAAVPSANYASSLSASSRQKLLGLNVLPGQPSPPTDPDSSKRSSASARLPDRPPQAPRDSHDNDSHMVDEMQSGHNASNMVMIQRVDGKRMGGDTDLQEVLERI